MVGIIQEQHPERARLFMQWKEMGWPVLVDSLNELDVSVVPLTFLVDEHGIIREISPRLSDVVSLETRFIDRRYEESAAPTRRDPAVPDLTDLANSAAGRGGGALRAYADALTVWGNDEDLDRAIELYRRAIGTDPEDALAHFRLGVALRRRYESPGRRAGDFQGAVQHWQHALQIDPNNYIWRRRIQQYGPRLDKPYPFYDWVKVAREEIWARGEDPVSLAVEPRGAELAAPARTFATAPGTDEPDPGGRIRRDPGEFVGSETTVVPARSGPGTATRVHVTLRPRSSAKAHWNNEVGDLALWVQPPAGWKADSNHLTYPNPATPVSQEARSLEFELMVPGDAPTGYYTVGVYALYYVCEDVNGACLYRRQDLPVELQIVSPSSR